MNNLELLLLVLAILGGLDLAGRGFNVLTAFFPALLNVQATLWRSLASRIELASFRRKAVSVHIEQVLNQTASAFQIYLPRGVVKRARIRWVRTGGESFLHDGEIILKVRPDKDYDRALMHALWLYFQRTVLPEHQGRLPTHQQSGIALAIARAAIEISHQHLLESFDKHFLPTATTENLPLLQSFSDSVRLNDFGLLMGPFMRELQSCSNGLRFYTDRQQLGDTADAVVQHLLGFQPLLRYPNKLEGDWALNERGASYALLLVSKPPETRPDLTAYVKRVQAHLGRGIQRFYILGRQEERDFVGQVMKAISSLPELKGIEHFALFRDYRGEPSGLGAMFAVDSVIAALRLPPKPIELRYPQGVDEAIQPQSVFNAGSMEDLARTAEAMIVQLSDYEGAWIALAEFGNRLRQQMTDFTPEKYGGRNLYSVLKGLRFLEFDERGTGPAKAVYVRIRQGSELVNLDEQRPAWNPVWSRVEEVIRSNAEEDGWIYLAKLGSKLRWFIPGFSHEVHGASTFREFLASIPTIEIQERGNGHSRTYVRLRADA